MSRTKHYQDMRVLALQKRQEHAIATATLNLRKMQEIYKAERIRIDPWIMKGSRIRAAYFCDNEDYSVMVNKTLPREPKLFALAHELKHHYVDRKQIQKGEFQCGDYNANQIIEIGAEIFAAEFIYPENEMRELIENLNLTAANCTPEKIVEFKRSCPATVSYKFIVKRFEWFGLCKKGESDGKQFQKLEESIYGKPIYKERWFQRYRARKKYSASIR